MSEKRKESDNAEPVSDAKKLRYHNVPEEQLKPPGDDDKPQLDEAEDSTQHHLHDKDVGITRYISNHVGFKGILKQRYTDFMVWERDLEGEIAHLTNLELPRHKSKDAPDIPDMSVIFKLPRHTQAALWKLTEDGGQVTEVSVPVPHKTKDQRRALHQAFRGLAPDVRSKVTPNGQIIVYKETRSNPDYREWPEGLPQYVHFILYKENVDTMRAISKLASRTRQQAKYFSYAGVKDKRGSSSQWVSIRRLPPKQIVEAVADVPNIRVGNFTYKTESLELGDLKGNRFAIVLRNLDSDEDVVNTALNNVKDRGFINYYGLQRFGTTTIPTHHIGCALLRKSWKEAVELVLKPRPDDREIMKEARELWWSTRNHEATLKVLRRLRMGDTIEAQLLHCLNRSDSYKDAFSRLPRNFKSLYMHAYQSFLWNHVVDKRLEEHGLNVLPGDLVYVDEENDRDSKRGRGLPKVKKIKEDDVDTTDISDVLIPLVGYDTEYPDNGTKQMIFDQLEKDGFNRGTLIAGARMHNLNGQYRKMIVKPTDMAWSYSRYSDPTVPLILTDKDILDGVKLQPTDGDMLGVTIELTLPSGCYATMALREAMKVETSWHSMVKLQEEMGQSVAQLKEKMDVKEEEDS